MQQEVVPLMERGWGTEIDGTGDPKRASSAKQSALPAPAFLVAPQRDN